MNITAQVTVYFLDHTLNANFSCNQIVQDLLNEKILAT